MTKSFTLTTPSPGDTVLASFGAAVIIDMRELMYNNQARLSLTTDPDTTTDVTGATTIYLEPYNGGSVSTFRTSGFRNQYQITEMSYALNTTDHPADTNFDVFLYDDSAAPNEYGNLALNVRPTSDNTMQRLDGVYTLAAGAGAGPAYLYIGSFRTSAAGQTEDSLTKRLLCNFFNPIEKPMYVEENTENQTTTDTAALWNGSTTNNQLEFMVCRPNGIFMDIGIRARMHVATAGQYARIETWLDGAEYTTPGINASYYDEQYVKLSDIGRATLTTGYHYLNAYIEGTDGGTATFRELRLYCSVYC